MSRPQIFLHIGHCGTVSAIAFSPDSKRLVSGGYDGTVKLWHPRTGRLIRALFESPEPVNSLVFSPDGKTLACVTGFGVAVAVLDARTGKLQRMLHARADCAAFLPCGNAMVIGSYSAVSLWSVRTGKRLWMVGRPEEDVQEAFVSPDGRTVAFKQKDSLCMRDADTGADRGAITLDVPLVSPLAISPDWKTLAGVAREPGPVKIPFELPDGSRAVEAHNDLQTLTLWNLPDGTNRRPLKKLLFDEKDGALAFSPDGRWLAAASRAQKVLVWNVQTGALEKTLSAAPNSRTLGGRGHWLRCVKFSPDGSKLAAAGDERAIRIWDAENWALTKVLASNTGKVRSVAVSTGGDLLASAGSDGAVRLWDIRKFRLQRTLAGHYFLRSVEFSRDGHTIASTAADGIRLWDARTGRSQRYLSLNDPWQGPFDLSPDTQSIANLDRRGRVTLWDARTGKQKAEYEISAGSTWGGGLRYSPDGKTLAVEVNGEVFLLDVGRGTIHQRLPRLKREGGTVSLAYSPDGAILATGQMGYAVVLWDPKTGEIIQKIALRADSAGAVAFSPDGKLLAVGTSYDNNVTLWDWKTGTLQRILKGHRNAIGGVAFLPDGKVLASGSYDGTVRLWDFRRGWLIATLMVLPSGRGPGEISKDWLAFAPHAYLAGSANATRFIRWK